MKFRPPNGPFAFAYTAVATSTSVANSRSSIQSPLMMTNVLIEKYRRMACGHLSNVSQLWFLYSSWSLWIHPHGRICTCSKPHRNILEFRGGNCSGGPSPNAHAPAPSHFPSGLFNHCWVNFLQIVARAIITLTSFRCYIFLPSLKHFALTLWGSGFLSILDGLLIFGLLHFWTFEIVLW